MSFRKQNPSKMVNINHTSEFLWLKNQCQHGQS